MAKRLICQRKAAGRQEHADNLMDRTRAAVGYINAQPRSKPALELTAFLELFHPEIPEEKRRQMVCESK